LTTANERLLVADRRRFPGILEWPVLILGLRNRSQLSLTENGGSGGIQSPPMQINADCVCLIRTQLQQIDVSAPGAGHRATHSTKAKPGAKAGLCFPS
jgi:hypothetical protein